MREINFSADRLVSALLKLSETETVSFLDSCGVSHLESHLLIAGIRPVETVQISNENAEDTLKIFDEKISDPNLAGIFTIAYDFGLKLENIEPREKEFSTFAEPDVFLALFDCLVVHDYNENKTFITGNEKTFGEIENALFNSPEFENFHNLEQSKVTSNFTREQYLGAVEKIKTYIKRGDTYQTNLTQQIRAELPEKMSPQQIFFNLRQTHPAPFAAFLKRENNFVVSISPERFFCVQTSESKRQSSLISASPIKGTRQRGQNQQEDIFLQNELKTSEKDRAENVMIVDLLRNDIGKICLPGSVNVERLCDLETHPTLFHLVSTVNGALREDSSFSDIIKAVFPCGSITGAPKIRTMRIIDELETAGRGLSMGAIGYSILNSNFKIQNCIDMSVAIRTMIVRENEAIFNVGGGIVADSIAEDEYEETFVKAKALLRAINGSFT